MRRSEGEPKTRTIHDITGDQNMIYKKPISKPKRTITKQDYKELMFYAEKSGNRNAVTEAMKLYKISIGNVSNMEALQLIHGYASSQ